MFEEKKFINPTVGTFTQFPAAFFPIDINLIKMQRILF